MEIQISQKTATIGSIVLFIISVTSLFYAYPSHNLFYEIISTFATIIYSIAVGLIIYDYIKYRR